MLDENKFKQALVVRLDLGMGRGKLAVQCAHAAVSAADKARTDFPAWWKAWIGEGQCKVALKVRKLEALIELEGRARGMNLPFYKVTDRGLTQIPPGSVTCLGIGPAPSDLIDRLTGDLALL